MDLQKNDVLVVLEVLTNRIAHLLHLVKFYPDSSLSPDWKSEISVLENFCNELESFDC